MQDDIVDIDVGEDEDEDEGEDDDEREKPLQMSTCETYLVPFPRPLMPLLAYLYVSWK